MSNRYADAYSSLTCVRHGEGGCAGTAVGLSLYVQYTQDAAIPVWTLGIMRIDVTSTKTNDHMELLVSDGARPLWGKRGGTFITCTESERVRAGIAAGLGTLSAG